MNMTMQDLVDVLKKCQDDIFVGDNAFVHVEGKYIRIDGCFYIEKLVEEINRIVG